MARTDTPSDDLAAGWAALNRAAWAEARVAFERALAAEGSAEVHDGLGLALWWLNEIEAAHRHRAVAYRLYRENGANGRAARIACWLAREQVFLNGNVPAMQGWFARAEPLVEREGSDADWDWFLILRASLTAAPEEMIAVAGEVIDDARRFRNGDLEAFALAFYGQALVTLGEVSDGTSALDEAMTMALGGEVNDLTIISEIFCVMLSTCEVAGDLARSELWCRTAMEFAQRYSCPFLSAYCRTSYGGLMAALGRWREAEKALLEAVSAFDRGHRGLKIHALIKLADLRVSQGKIEEAGVLLDGLEDQSSAVIPLARLQQQKGELALARATLEQALPAPPTLHRLPALLLLVDVLLEMNEPAEVSRRMAALSDLVERTHSRLLEAQLAFTRGKVSLHAGDYNAARGDFNTALEHLRSYEQSLLAGQVRLRMAQTLQTSDPAGAVAWARGALATFERVGAEYDSAQAAALLRRMGAASRGGMGRPSSAAAAGLTAREMEIATLVAQGLTNRDIAARLVISPKTVEHHVGRVLDKLNLNSRVELAAYAAGGKLGEGT